MRRADSPHSEYVMVPMAFNIQECCTLNGRFIHFIFQLSIVDDSGAKSGGVNAFSVLMARVKGLP